MSYNEYINMFKLAQKKECPFRAFMFDVVNSRNNQEYLSTKNTKFFKLLNCVYFLLQKEEEKTNKAILLKGKNNAKYSLGKKVINGNNYNPMHMGDMVTFFVYNNSITTNQMLKIFISALKICKITYSFHFNTGVYETNNYSQGKTKLYKGYMPQILEVLSKKNNIIISQNGYTNEK